MGCKERLQYNKPGEDARDRLQERRGQTPTSSLETQAQSHNTVLVKEDEGSQTHYELITTSFD